MLSVGSSLRALACAYLFLCAFSIRNVSPDIAGQWSCVERSGQAGDQVAYHLYCEGEVHFKPDGVVKSSCRDALIPNGALWHVQGGRLLLSDSSGRLFAEYDIQQSDSKRLRLIRNGVSYLFERTVR